MIETIYEELRKLGAVRNRDDFSRNWLGMEKSYMRVMRAKHREPSAKAVATCAARLKTDSQRLKGLESQGYQKAADRLEKMADACIAEMLHKHRP